MFIKKVSFFFFRKNVYWECAYAKTCIWRSEDNFLPCFSPYTMCGSQGSNLCLQAWLQVPLLAEPSPYPKMGALIKIPSSQLKWLSWYFGRYCFPVFFSSFFSVSFISPNHFQLKRADHFSFKQTDCWALLRLSISVSFEDRFWEMLLVTVCWSWCRTWLPALRVDGSLPVCSSFLSICGASQLQRKGSWASEWLWEGGALWVWWDWLLSLHIVRCEKLT